jgi:hypothetical protein
MNYFKIVCIFQKPTSQIANLSSHYLCVGDFGFSMSLPLSLLDYVTSRVKVPLCKCAGRFSAWVPVRGFGILRSQSIPELKCSFKSFFLMFLTIFLILISFL